MERRLTPLALKPWDFLDLVSTWLMDGISEEGKKDLETFLIQPPPNAIIEADDPLWSADAESEMFNKMFAQNGD